MNSGLALHALVDVAAGGLHDSKLAAAGIGVSLVVDGSPFPPCVRHVFLQHFHDILSEQRAFAAADPGPDLDFYFVCVFVLLFGDEHFQQFAFDLLDGLIGLLELILQKFGHFLIIFLTHLLVDLIQVADRLLQLFLERLELSQMSKFVSILLSLSFGECFLLALKL